MFREKLHKDLDGISPDEELLLKITKSMQEEVQKPKPKIYSTALRFGGMAAAICMIAVGAVVLTSNNGIKTGNTAVADESAMYSDKAANEVGKAETNAAANAEFYAEVESAESYSPSAESFTDGAEETYAEEASGEYAEESSQNVAGAVTLPEYKNKGIYEAIVTNPDVIGPPQTLEELMSDKERNKNINSFCRIKITDIITPDNAKKLNGWNEYYSDADAFFYNAVIEYDYFTDYDVSIPIILRQSGLNYGSPAYAQGDTLAALIMNAEGEITRLFSYAFIYDIYEIDGIDYGASRGQSVPEVEEGLTNHFDAQEVIYETTTPYNPAVYYGLFEIEEIAESLKSVIGAEITHTASTTDDETAAQETTAKMSRHILSSEVMHCSEMGLSFDPSVSNTVEIGISLPSEWELSATVASINGIKAFEISPPYPSNETYNYESFKIDEAHGYDVLVHEEKYGSETDPFIYYIFITVGDYNVRYYVINCGEYNLYLHFNAEHDIDEQTIYDIIASVTVTTE